MLLLSEYANIYTYFMMQASSFKSGVVLLLYLKQLFFMFSEIYKSKKPSDRYDLLFILESACKVN